MPQCPESPLACGAPLPTPRHASCAASLPHALHVRAHDKAQDTQTGTAAGTPLQATSEQGGRSSSLLLTPAARGMSVASHRRGGHPSSASAEPDDRISLEAEERIRAGARGSRELLRCRCSRVEEPAPSLRRGSLEDVPAGQRITAAPAQPQPAAPAPALATSEAVASVRLNREISAMKMF